jgi:hypothetical protein
MMSSAEIALAEGFHHEATTWKAPANGRKLTPKKGFVSWMREVNIDRDGLDPNEARAAARSLIPVLQKAVATG